MPHSTEVMQDTSNGTTAFDRQVAVSGRAGLHSAPKLDVIQVNIGLTCNLICTHCHVNSSPRRKEQMDWATMEAILDLVKTSGVRTIDITGGAPEMNPEFRRFVRAVRASGIEVMVRTNLVILLESGYEDIPEFYRDYGVHLVASLPCYIEENVDKQRGEGVYNGSVEVIRILNGLGYGKETDLKLDLVYNPIGDALPPEQSGLEHDFREALRERFDISFTKLYTITNIPIGRFRGDLRKQKKLDAYMDLLRQSFNPGTVERLMCRHQVSVAWDGALYDCDFNLAQRLAIGNGTVANVRNVDARTLVSRRIVTGDHCYACTAGAGSSCGGSLV